MKKSIVLATLMMALSGFGLPNPAHVFCVKNGGVSETRADKDGNQYGMCLFDQGGMKSECDQWEFFRGNCVPGECLHWSIETRSCEILP